MCKFNITGNKMSIYGVYGDVDVDKLLDAINYLSGEVNFNTTWMNNQAAKGKLYVREGGTIFKDTSKTSENLAKFCIIPTGFKVKGTEFPIFASFIKLNGMWEGAMINSGEALFNGYKQHFNGTFNDMYLDIFSNSGRYMNIEGQGLDEVLNNWKNKSAKVIPKEPVGTMTEKLNNIDLSKLAKEGDNVNNKPKDTDDISEDSLYDDGVHTSKIKKHNSHVKVSDLATDKGPKQPLKKRRTKKEMEEARRIAAEAIDSKKGILFESDKAHGVIKATVQDGYDTSKISTKPCTKPHVEPIKSTDADIIDKVVMKPAAVTPNIIKPVTNIVAASAPVKRKKQVIFAISRNNDTKSVKELREQAKASKSAMYSDKDKKEAVHEVMDKFFDSIKKESVDTVIDSMNADIDSDNGSDSTIKAIVSNAILTDISNRLLIKEHWDADIQKRNRLGFYLKGLFIVAYMNMAKMLASSPDERIGNGFILSDDGTKAVVNTGLIDKYMNYIYIVDKSPSIANFYAKDVMILTNKSALVQDGFNIKNIKTLPEPVKYYDDISELTFSDDIDSIDLDDEMHLSHIITDRKYRIPSRYRNESESSLCNRLRQAIRQAVMISKVNSRYLIPKYDFTRHEIQFLIPFYFDNSIDDSPELTIVIGNNNGIWTPYTILYTNIAYDDARLVGSPAGTWLDNINKHGGK